ncbi:MAG TPA: sugar-binding protein [Ferruginibacter sp.]|jgi:gliding motility-associated-like protein|nr:sugar-binding protein [Ferruginibacter sp.]
MKKTTLFGGTISLPQNLLKRLLLTCFGMVTLLSSSVFAQVAHTSTGAGGNWNVAATWNPASVPATNDPVTIASGSPVTLIAAVTQTNTITINSGGKLTLGANLTDNGSSISVNGTLDCGAFLVNGTCNFTFNSGTSDTLKIGDSNGITPAGTALGSIQNTGTRSFGANSTYTYESANTGVVQFTGTGLPTTVRNIIINRSVSTDTVALTNNNTTLATNSGGGFLTLNKGIFNVDSVQTLIFNGNGGGINNPTVGASNFAAGSPNGSAEGTISCITGGGGSFVITGPGLTTFNSLTAPGQNPGLQIVDANSVLINGTLPVSAGNTNNFFKSSGITNPPIYGAVSSLIIDCTSSSFGPNNAAWNATSGYIIGTTAGYPNNVQIQNLANGSSSNIANGQNINGVLTIGDASGANTSDPANNCTFFSGTTFSCGGIVINTGSTFKAPSGTLTVNGSWSRLGSGAYNNNSGSVAFGAGTCGTPNTISAPAGESFINLSLNTNAYLSLNTPTTVTGTFAFATGSILTTTSTNVLKVTNSSSSAIIRATNAYVNGPLNWSLSAAAAIYHFPVGSGTCTRDSLPFTLNKPSGGALTATVQAFNVGSGGTVDATLSSLSTTEYWSLATSAGLTLGTTISVARPIAIAPLAYIGQSTTTSNGTYTSIGGTAVTYGVDTSNSIALSSPLFFALGTPPIVSTLAATSITTTSVTLNGGFNTQGSSLPTSFTYGLGASTTGLGAPASIHTPITSSSEVVDSALITGLTANTLYSYIATDSANSGTAVSFITAPNPPVVGTPNTATGNGFTATWSAPAAMGAAPYTYTIQVSTDPTFATGDSTYTGISSASTSYVFTTLASATTYYYRVEAVNATASSVWSATSASITTSLSPTPSTCTTGTGSTTSTGAITKASILPVIDGQVDPVWAAVPPNNISFVSVNPPGTGNTQTWKAMWTTDSLYLLIQVTDPTLISQSSALGGIPVAGAIQSNDNTDYYGSDGVELTLDPDYSHLNHYDLINDAQFRFNLGATSISGQSSGTATQFTGTIFNRVAPLIDYKTVVVPGVGYNVEVAIPWGTSGTNPGIDSIAGGYGVIAPNKNIGLEIQVNDATNTSGRAAQYSWFNGSTDPYENPSQFAEATLTTCTAPPIVVLPTATAITATGATLGATVTSSGDALLTARGTAYTASPDNSASGNTLAEGGTAVSIYSGPARTGLTPQTKYYYLGYATNANNETGVSTIDSFYTLSQIPTVQPTLTAAACTQMVLNWTPVTFPPVGQATQTGYLVIRSVAPTVPTTAGISTRIATVQSALPAGDTLVTTINSGAITTYTDATAKTGITYNYILVPFTWDGVTADSTYNYFVTAPANVSASIGTGLAAPTAVAGSQPTCTVSTGSINITQVVGITYSIDGSNYFLASDPTFTALPAATYNVTAKNAAGCISLPTPVTINPAPGAPSAPIATPTQPTCTTSTGSIAITQVAGETYSIDGTNYFLASDPTFTGLGTAIYNVSSKNGSGCISSSTTPVTIDTIPTTLPLPTVDSTQPTCTVSTGSIAVTSPASGVTYSFDNGATYGASATVSGLTANTNYQVGVENGTCKSAFVSATIDTIPTTFPLPTVDSTQPTCTVSTGSITVTSPTSGVTYSFDNGASYGASATVSGLTANTNYQVGVENGTCKSAFVSATIDTIPTTFPLPTVDSTQPTCTVSTGSITVTSPASGVTYSFDNGASYGASATVSGLTANTNYQVGVENGTCKSAFVSATIDTIPTTFPLPTVDSTQPTCTVSTGSITVTSPASGVTYSFDNGASYGASATSTNLPANTNYQVGVESGTCKSGFVSASIDTIPTVPIVSITDSNIDTTINPGTQITLYGTSNPVGTSYAWTGSPLNVDTPSDSTTTVSPAVTSTYTLTVQTAAGCSGFAQKTINVNGGCTLTIPNAFTPNGDGINDIWFISSGSGCFSNLSVDVYNRWGSLIYHSDNYSNTWDGTYQGHPVPDATYYYAVTAKGVNVIRTVKGSVTILR